MEHNHDPETHSALTRIECLLRKMYERDGMILDVLESLNRSASGLVFKPYTYKPDLGPTVYGQEAIDPTPKAVFSSSADCLKEFNKERTGHS